MRPRVHINFAMSIDGKMALPDRRQTRISNREDMARVHGLRNSSDAIMVGVGTVLTDDPKLTVREEYLDGRPPAHPTRVIVDTHFRSPRGSMVLDGSVDTIILTGEEVHPDAVSGLLDNVHIIPCPSADRDRVDLARGLGELSKAGIGTLLVEGGGTLIGSLVRGGLVDRMTVFIGPVFIGGDLAPTPGDGPGARGPEDVIALELESTGRLGNGVLLSYVPVRLT